MSYYTSLCVFIKSVHHVCCQRQINGKDQLSLETSQRHYSATNHWSLKAKCHRIFISVVYALIHTWPPMEGCEEPGVGRTELLDQLGSSEHWGTHKTRIPFRTGYVDPWNTGSHSDSTAEWLHSWYGVCWTCEPSRRCPPPACLRRAAAIKKPEPSHITESSQPHWQLMCQATAPWKIKDSGSDVINKRASDGSGRGDRCKRTLLWLDTEMRRARLSQVSDYLLMRSKSHNRNQGTVPAKAHSYAWNFFRKRPVCIRVPHSG